MQNPDNFNAIGNFAKEHKEGRPADPATSHALIDCSDAWVSKDQFDRVKDALQRPALQRGIFPGIKTAEATKVS
jgi:hypothetical protein